MLLSSIDALLHTKELHSFQFLCCILLHRCTILHCLILLGPLIASCLTNFLVHIYVFPMYIYLILVFAALFYTFTCILLFAAFLCMYTYLHFVVFICFIKTFLTFPSFPYLQFFLPPLIASIFQCLQFPV